MGMDCVIWENVYKGLEYSAQTAGAGNKPAPAFFQDISLRKPITDPYSPFTDDHSQISLFLFKRNLPECDICLESLKKKKTDIDKV